MNWHGSRSSWELGDKLINASKFHLRTLWLFNANDLTSIVLPSTFFALFGGLACALDDSHTFAVHSHLPPLGHILLSVPQVLWWAWINLLSFSINNQRSPQAVAEDALNKPWRPIPSRRLSSKSAAQLLPASHLSAIITSIALGNLTQCLGLIILGYMYNNRGGGDTSWLSRNVINAGGFTCFSSGALQVVLASYGSAMKIFGWWSFVIAAIIFTTVHTQDMYDQEGDATRNRRTVPLVIGDGPARISIAFAMAVWCWLSSWLWRSTWIGYVGPVSLGLTVMLRTLLYRSVVADKNTFRIWNLWLVSIYLLPVLRSVGV